MNVSTYSPWLAQNKTDATNRFAIDIQALGAPAPTAIASAVETWTIECAGVEQSLDEWGLSNLVRNQASRGPCTVTFQETGDFTAAPLFAFDAQIIIRRARKWSNGVWAGGSQWFVGIITKIPRRGSASDESKSYIASDPWRWLQNRIFKQRWNAGFEDAPVWKATSHLMLGVAAVLAGVQAERLSTKEQMEEILDWCIANGDPIQYDSSEFPDMDIYPEEIRERTCAECLIKMLRFAPDAVTWWDHTTSPPTFHAARRSDLTAATFALGTKPLGNIDIARDDENVPACVQLLYEITNVVDGQACTGITEDIYPTTATGNESGAFIETIDMRGYEISYLRAELVCSTIDITSPTWWKVHRPQLDHASVTSITITNTAIKNAAGTAISLTTYPRKLDKGQIAPWMGMTVGGSVVPVIAVEATAFATIRVTFTKTDGTTDVMEEQVSTKIIATNAISGYYFSVADFTAADPIPVGLAHALYDAMSQPHYNGSVTLNESEVNTALIAAGITDRTGVGLVVNITGGHADWTTMRALVQQCTEEVDTGITTFSIGATEHLGPRDLVTQSQINRFRVKWNNPNARVAGVTAMANRVTLGKETSKENTSAALPDFKQFSMTTTNGASVPKMMLDVADIGSITIGAAPVIPEIRFRRVKYCKGGTEYWLYGIFSKLYDATSGAEVEIE